MNRERARELLPIIEAFANGEEIENKSSRQSDEHWGIIHKPSWCPGQDYRIKPKPREFWLVAQTEKTGYLLSDREQKTGEWPDAIRVREVTDETM